MVAGGRVGVRLPSIATLSLVSSTDSLLLLLAKLSCQLPPKLGNHIQGCTLPAPKGIEGMNSMSGTSNIIDAHLFQQPLNQCLDDSPKYLCSQMVASAEVRINC